MTWLSSSPVPDSADSPSSGASAEGWTWDELSVGDPAEVVGGGDSPQDSGPTLEEELDRAFRRGLKQGESRGEERAREDLGPALEAIRMAAEQLTELRNQWSAVMEKNVAALALAVARQLVDREIKESPEIISGLVGRALAHFPLDAAVRIRVNPLDLSSISGALPDDESRAPVAAGRDVRWIPDASIGRGGCVVEGPERIIDGRLETALERLYRGMTDG